MAWLDTLGSETIATIRATPDQTIVPAHESPTTGATRALATFAELAGHSLAGERQLRHGDVIGEGGMGVIRAAEQVSLARTVAVKTLKESRQSPAAMLDLLREAWVTGSLEHPNIVPVHYLALDDKGLPLIVLKRIEGVEWRRLLGDAAEVERRFGATDLLAWNLGILLQVLNAVRFAHSRGIVHRDLKPSNVMIGDFGEVYLLDWGIAVSLRGDPTGRLPLAAQATELAGTPSYMAPEMLGRAGSPPISERTDVYLAGAVLHELVTGRAPHAGKDAVSVITSIITSQPALPPGIPAELARICTTAMHEDPAERFESAEALQLAVQRYLEHRGSMQLEERARMRFEQLRSVLAGAPAGRPREEVYRQFGACRSGFHDALAVWPENADARTGLAAAIVAVAEYELASENPTAAVSVLSELDEPSPLLERARSAAAIQARRRAELEQLERLHDPVTGSRTRSFLVVIFGLAFTIGPLALAIGGMQARSYTMQLGISLGAVLVIVAAGWWARVSMLATLINRRVFATSILLFVLQALLVAGTALAGISAAVGQIMMLFLYASMCATLAIWLHPRLALSATGYTVAFLLAARVPEARLYAMSAGNLIFTINGVWLWQLFRARYMQVARSSSDAA